MLAESELKRVRFALLVRLRAILTPEQQQKLEELKKQDHPGDPSQCPPLLGEAPWANCLEWSRSMRLVAFYIFSVQLCMQSQ